MTSSAEEPHHHHLAPPFAAPPPTPSTLPLLSSTTPDLLSHLLHRLPPTLSLSIPTRRSSPLSATATPPVISLSDHSSLLSSSTDLGFFHLSHHPLPSHLPLSAESAALSLFNLPHHRKHLLFPNNWPLGHETGGADDDDFPESFCLEPGFSTDGSDLDLDSLHEFIREMEKLGLDVVEEVASAVGFGIPGRDELCSMLWISNGMNKPGRTYPYAVALHYQIRGEKHSLLSDSGWVSVSGRPDSVFVTLGDIAQVWSNGKVKKVRGRGFPISSDDKGITMSLLLSLPPESTICPLVPDLVVDEEVESTNNTGEKRLFDPFSLEDYAWRVYHERLLLKDPLIRYRTSLLRYEVNIDST